MMCNAISRIFFQRVIVLILLVVGASLMIVNVVKADKQTHESPPYEVKSSTIPGHGTANDERHSWKFNRLALRVERIQPKNGVISAYEPVIVKAVLTNVSSGPVSVYQSTDESTRIEVRDSLGRLVGDTPVYSYCDQLSISSSPLEPGQSIQSFFIPSAVYEFKSQGSYSVRIMLLDITHKIVEKPSDLGPIAAEATIIVNVKPFDEKQLEKVCNELLKPYIKQPSCLSDFPPIENMKALWSIHHNAALPSLKLVANYWGKYYVQEAAVAIRRIGTSESDALLKTIMHRQDRIGKLARAAIKADVGIHQIHDSDYFTGWAKIKPSKVNKKAMFHTSIIRVRRYNDMDCTRFDGHL